MLMGVVARIQIFFLFYFKIMIDIIEEWRPVVGYEGLYEVSNIGRVRSLDRYVKGKGKSYFLHKGRVLSPGIKTEGYLIVRLQRRMFYVHRLVTEAFLPNPDNLPEVNHKDEDKTNNRVENLEWCDHKYNMNYGTRNIRAKETAIKNGYWTGLRSGLSKKEYNRKYYQDNRDKFREYHHQYYLKKKEQIQNNVKSLDDQI